MTGSSGCRRRWACAVPLALALATAIPALPGCNETRRANQEYRKQERDRRAAMKKVQERAEEYLLAVRWRDFQKASEYYEETSDRVKYLQRMTESSTSHPTIESFTVDFVLVDETLERAEVRVSLSEVDPRTQSLVARTDTLLWYHTDRTVPKDWFLVPVTVVEPGS